MNEHSYCLLYNDDIFYKNIIAIKEISAIAQKESHSNVALITLVVRIKIRRESLFWVNLQRSISSHSPFDCFIYLSELIYCFRLKLILNFYPLPVTTSMIANNRTAFVKWFWVWHISFSFYVLIIKMISTSWHFR